MLIVLCYFLIVFQQRFRQTAMYSPFQWDSVDSEIPEESAFVTCIFNYDLEARDLIGKVTPVRGIHECSR